MYSVYNLDDSTFNFEKEYKKALIASIKLLDESDNEVIYNNDLIISYIESIKTFNQELNGLIVYSNSKINSLVFNNEDQILRFVEKLKKLLNLLENNILITGEKIKSNLNVSKNIWDLFTNEIIKLDELIDKIDDVLINKSVDPYVYKQISLASSVKKIETSSIFNLIQKFYNLVNNNLKPLLDKIFLNYNQTIEGDKLLSGNGLMGDGLYVNDFKYFLNQSYEKNRDQFYKDWEYIPQYSDLRTAIYKNKNTNEIVVSNRGTYDLKDVGTDIKAFLDKKDNRLKSYKNLISRIKKDYPNSYIISIGHSLGGLVARQDASVDEILTFNKPTMLRELFKEQPKNQYEVRSTNDPVSILSKYKLNRRNRGNNITFDSQSNNPLKAHSLSSLDNLPDTEYIGNPNK